MTDWNDLVDASWEIHDGLCEILAVQKELLEMKRKEIPLHPIDEMCELGSGTRCLNFRWENGKLTTIPQYQTKDSGGHDPEEENANDKFCRTGSIRLENPPVIPQRPTVETLGPLDPCDLHWKGGKLFARPLGATPDAEKEKE